MMIANAVLPRIALIKKLLPCHSNPCTAHRFLDHPASSHQLRRRSVDSHYGYCKRKGCLWSVPDRVRCQGRCCHPWDWRPANDKLGRAACSAIGCPAGGIRLTNWDAHALAEHVHKGTRWILLIDHVWVVPECLKPKFPLVNARGRARNTHGYPLLELSLPDEVPDFLPGTAFSLDDLSEG